MIDRCPFCNSCMKVLFTSWYCPKNCDKNTQKKGTRASDMQLFINGEKIIPCEYLNYTTEGKDLDSMAALYGLTRCIESDSSLRDRIKSCIPSFNKNETTYDKNKPYFIYMVDNGELVPNYNFFTTFPMEKYYERIEN